MRRTWDHIVIGGGSAGAVVAARLAEDQDRRVLLVEAGGRDWSPRIHVPGLVESLLGSHPFNWSYRGDPDPSLDGRSLTWAAGRGLGGSSSINGMVYGRGLPADYERWVAAGNPGWGWNDLLPWFRKSEQWGGVPHPTRGTSGPLSVRRFEETDPACASAMAALIARGVPAVEDYSIGIAEGVGLTQATQKRGWRHSSAAAYLRRSDASGRANLTILTHSPATALLLDDDVCVGVRIVRGGGTTDLFADREVTLAAGAIATPRLLLLSGIGPPDGITPHGIRVVHPLTGVGADLNEHVNVLLSAHVDRRTYNSQRHGLVTIRHGLRFLAAGSGPASSPANHVQAFVRTNPAGTYPDIQLQLMPVGFGTEAEMAHDGITAVVSPCRPNARGRIALRSADPADPPRITMRILDDAADRATLLRGCRLAAAVLQEGPGRIMGGRRYRPALATESEADWLAYIRATAGINWHPTSTCRMGPDADRGAVVDAALRVRGLQRLGIADASIMPTVISGNTNAPVIAIAERAAALIAARTA